MTTEWQVQRKVIESKIIKSKVQLILKQALKSKIVAARSLKKYISTADHTFRQFYTTVNSIAQCGLKKSL